MSNLRIIKRNGESVDFDGRAISWKIRRTWWRKKSKKKF